VQIRWRETLLAPGEMASALILRSGSIASEAFGLVRDIVITTEGVLSWVTGLALRGGPDLYAADVAADPFASPWDDVVRTPRCHQRHPRGSVAPAGVDLAPDAKEEQSSHDEGLAPAVCPSDRSGRGHPEGNRVGAI
jgi:hypothetical protein